MLIMGPHCCYIACIGNLVLSIKSVTPVETNVSILFIYFQMSAICLCCGRLAGMLTIALYTPMQEYLSQGGLLYLYSGVSFLAMPVSYYFVKETVGKNVG